MSECLVFSELVNIRFLVFSQNSCRSGRKGEADKGSKVGRA